jgi:hypothetical protein
MSRLCPSVVLDPIDPVQSHISLGASSVQALPISYRHGPHRFGPASYQPRGMPLSRRCPFPVGLDPIDSVQPHISPGASYVQALPVCCSGPCRFGPVSYQSRGTPLSRRCPFPVGMDPIDSVQPHISLGARPCPGSAHLSSWIPRFGPLVSLGYPKSGIFPALSRVLSSDPFFFEGMPDVCAHLFISEEISVLGSV